MLLSFSLVMSDFKNVSLLQSVLSGSFSKRNYSVHSFPVELNFEDELGIVGFTELSALFQSRCDNNKTVDSKENLRRRG